MLVRCSIIARRSDAGHMDGVYLRCSVGRHSLCGLLRAVTHVDRRADTSIDVSTVAPQQAAADLPRGTGKMADRESILWVPTLEKDTNNYVVGREEFDEDRF